MLDGAPTAQFLHTIAQAANNLKIDDLWAEKPHLVMIFREEVLTMEEIAAD